MNKLCLFLALGTVLMLGQSCRTAYTPNALNVPLLQEQGELKVMVNGPNAQAAYAVSDHIGVMVNGRYISSSTSTSVNGSASDSYDSKNSVLEAGVGYFTRSGRNMTFECYGGGGITQVGFHGTGASAGKNYDVSGLKFFLQPNFGFVSQGFDIALSTRLSGLQFGTAISNYSAADMKAYELDGLGKTTHLFLEPAITLRGGYKYVKLQAQLGGSFRLTSGNIPYNGFIGNLGLVFDFARWFNN